MNLWRPEEDVRYPRARIIGRCEPLNVGGFLMWILQTGQPAYVTIEQPLQPLRNNKKIDLFYFLCISVFSTVCLVS